MCELAEFNAGTFSDSGRLCKSPDKCRGDGLMRLCLSARKHDGGRKRLRVKEGSFILKYMNSSLKKKIK